MFDMYRSGVKTSVATFGMENVTLHANELFEPYGHIGPILWIAVFLSLYVLLSENSTHLKKSILFCLIAGSAGMLLATDLFPWHHVDHYTNGILNGIIQFPSRFILMSMLFFSIAGGNAFTRDFPILSGRSFLLVFMLAISFSMPAIPKLKETVSQSTSIPFGEGPSPFLSNTEYQFIDTNVADTRDHEPKTSADIDIVSYNKHGTNVEVMIKASSDGYLSLPLFGFEGYKVTLNGKEIPWYRGENNKITIDILSGTEGIIHIAYHGKLLWRILDIISFITLSSMLWLAFKYTRHTPYNYV